MGGGTNPFDYLLVKVDAVVNGVAVCSATGGSEHRVPLSRRVGAGGWAKAGDTWVLAKVNSVWVFHTVIDAGLTGPITITAPRDSMDAGTEQIFDALIRLGFLVEEDGDYRR